MARDDESVQVRLLEGIPLFAGLSGDERWNLARRATVRDVPDRTPLFWIGDAGDEFFVILSGRFAISYPDDNGAEVTLAALGPGDFLGELALLDGGPRTATARAVGDASVLALGREEFHKFVNECPSVAMNLLRVLGRRQRESVDKLRGIRNLNEVMQERQTTWQRVANAIADLASSRGFLLIHAAGFIGWIVFNLFRGPGGPDPYPFPFLCFWASSEAIFLSLFILISQNAQAQKDRIRTELEYQTALKAQFEIMQLHRKLDELPGMLLEQLRLMQLDPPVIGAALASDPDPSTEDAPTPWGP